MSDSIGDHRWMEIRRLGPADAPAYRALRLRALREHPEAFTSSWEEDQVKPLQASEARLRDPLTTLWGAFDGELLAGIVGLERLPRAKERHKGWIVGMYVAPESGRRGAGRALLDAVCATAQAEGLRDLLLSVTEGNAPALQLYGAVGFVVVGREPRAVLVDGRYLDKLHMHRPLS